VVALALLLPGVAHAAGGGVPSPDPSTQIAPDPAPSGGEHGTNGAGGQAPQQQQPSTHSTPPVNSSAPVTTTPATSTPASAQPQVHRRHRTAPAHKRVHHRAQPAPRNARPVGVRRLSDLFVASVSPALRTPAPAPDVGSHSEDALMLASIALLLFVFGGLMVMRTSAHVLRGERPA
jgi:hypothetical protein